MERVILIESGFVVDFSKVTLSEAVQASLSSDKGMYITLPVCVLDKPTANRRTYTTECMQKAIEEAQDAFNGRYLYCSVDDHPAGTHVAPGHASHIVVGAWIKEGILWNKWYILETQNGKNLKALIQGRTAIPTSIRGLGNIGLRNVIENYKYLGTDCVGNPAAGTYSIPGSEGVQVEVVESVLNEEHNFAKSFGYNQEQDSSNSSNKIFTHPDGHVVNYEKESKRYTFYNKDGSSKEFTHHVGLYTYLSKIHSKKESAVQEVTAGGFNINGVGVVNQNSVIEYRGVNWRVSNISGTPDQWQMTLSAEKTSGVSTWLNSENIPDPATEIRIVKESTESKSNMNRFEAWKSKIEEAAIKLRQLRLKENSQKEQIAHTSAFEYRMSQDNDLTADELKRVQEAWTAAKNYVEPAPKVEAKTDVPVELRIDTMQESITQLTKLVSEALSPKAPKSTKTPEPKVTPKVEGVINRIQEEEQAMVSLMKTGYGFDDGKIETALGAFQAHKDDPKSFAEEMVSTVGAGPDYAKLFIDLTDASGQYQQSGPAAGQNVPGLQISPEGQLEALLSKIDSGELLEYEEVKNIISMTITECRKAVNEAKKRELLAAEMVVEHLLDSSSKIKILGEKALKYSQLWEAAEIIINDLRNNTIKSQGKIVQSYNKDKIIRK